MTLGYLRICPGTLGAACDSMPAAAEPSNCTLLVWIENNQINSLNYNWIKIL